MRNPIAISILAAAMLGGCAGAPGVRFLNTDASLEQRAEAACRAEAGMGSGRSSAGASAAYQACMAEFRRPPRDDD